MNLRLAVVCPLERPRLSTLERSTGASIPSETRKIHSMLTQDALEYRVVQREHLRAGDTIEGPAAVEEAGTTTLIDAGDLLSVEDHGCLVVDVGKA